MTRAEMDKLNVGDKVEVKIYNTITEENEWIPVIVSRVLVCSDGGKFAHGGYHSVSAKINGFTETLDNELTRLCRWNYCSFGKSIEDVKGDDNMRCRDPTYHF